MYVYESFEPGLWTVGHYKPAGEFEPESDHGDREDAARRVAWLNGNMDEGIIAGRVARTLAYAITEAVGPMQCNDATNALERVARELRQGA